MRREKLADDAPDDGTPCRGIKGDEEARKDNHGRAGGGSGRGSGVVEREGADGSEDEEIDRHADTAYDQSLATTEALHNVETEEGHAEIDTTEDHCCHEAVVDACGVEDGSPIVEKKVCACELLQRLQDHAESGAICHSRAGDQLDPGPFA